MPMPVTDIYVRVADPVCLCVLGGWGGGVCVLFSFFFSFFVCVHKTKNTLIKKTSGVLVNWRILWPQFSSNWRPNYFTVSLSVTKNKNLCLFFFTWKCPTGFVRTAVMRVGGICLLSFYNVEANGHAYKNRISLRVIKMKFDIVDYFKDSVL